MSVNAIYQEFRRKHLIVNFDTKDLATLISTLQLLLQSSPNEPLIYFANLSYEYCNGSSSRSALDGTPFAPSRTKKGVQRSLTETNFNSEIFLPMQRVCLSAVIEVKKMNARLLRFFARSLLLSTVAPTVGNSGAAQGPCCTALHLFG